MVGYTKQTETDIPEWLRKCMSCTHAYTTQNEDLEIKCRLKAGCNFKQAKGRPLYKKELGGNQ